MLGSTWELQVFKIMEANAVVAKNCWNKSIPKRVCTENSTLTKQPTVVLGWKGNNCIKQFFELCRWFSSSTKFIWSGPWWVYISSLTCQEWFRSKGHLKDFWKCWVFRFCLGRTPGIFWDTLIHQPFGSTRLPFVVPWFSFWRWGFPWSLFGLMIPQYAQIYQVYFYIYTYCIYF